MCGVYVSRYVDSHGVVRRNLPPKVKPGLQYDTDIDPPLGALDITRTGSIVVVDVDGNRLRYAFPSISVIPYRLELPIKRIVGNGTGSPGDGLTGTNIPIADLIGLL